MPKSKRTARKRSYLSQAIPGYRGYSRSSFARKTDKIFSEEVLSQLSETVAIVGRMKRVGQGQLDPEMLSGLNLIVGKVQRLSRSICQAAPQDEVLLDMMEDGRSSEIMGLDSAILEKMGNVNQALSVMDLEAGVGISSEDVDSVSELLDDLTNDLRMRAELIAGRQD